MKKDTIENNHSISFREAFWVWVKIAAYSFGGPAGKLLSYTDCWWKKSAGLASNDFFMP